MCSHMCIVRGEGIGDCSNPPSRTHGTECTQWKTDYSVGKGGVRNSLPLHLRVASFSKRTKHRSIQLAGNRAPCACHTYIFKPARTSTHTSTSTWVLEVSTWTIPGKESLNVKEESRGTMFKRSPSAMKDYSAAYVWQHDNVRAQG